MKQTEKDLKAMFGQTPDSFTAAMERALAGETPAHDAPRSQRLSRAWVIVLLAVLALTLATGGYATAVRLGLLDLRGQEVSRVPQSAVDVLRDTQVQSWTVGPVRVSLNESIADGHVTYVICQSDMADGSDSLLVHQADDMYINTPESLQQRLGLEDGMLGFAAMAYEGPVYTVETRLEVAPIIEEMIMEAYYGSDGSLITGDATYPEPGSVGETVAGLLRVRVERIDLVSYGEYGAQYDALERWAEEFPVEIPVTGVMEARTYEPLEGEGLSWAEIEGIRAERTPAGVYIYADLLVTDLEKEIHGVSFRAVHEERGSGLYQITDYDDSDWPRVTLTTSLPIEEMPEALTLAFGRETVEVR